MSCPEMKRHFISICRNIPDGEYAGKKRGHLLRIFSIIPARSRIIWDCA